MKNTATTAQPTLALPLGEDPPLPPSVILALHQRAKYLLRSERTWNIGRDPVQWTQGQAACAV
jgi:hypothetical protein